MSAPGLHAEPGPDAEALFALARRTRGFMPPPEGEALWRAAVGLSADVPGPIVEIGAYCGASTLYLGAAARQLGRPLLSVDHHRGSEELQPGWPDHDPEVVDPRTGRIDTLPHWRRTIEEAGLERVVIGVVGDSATVASVVGGPVAMVLVDGGHGTAPAWADWRAWGPKVAPGGLLAIHDVFPDPAEGGRPPFEIYLAATSSGLFEPLLASGSLRVLVRIRP